MAVTVAAAGLAWLAVLLVGGGGLATGGPATGGPAGGAVSASVRMIREAVSITWPAGRPFKWAVALRYAAGAAALVAAWWCVYTMPRDFASGVFFETHALHVAAASWAVAWATMLITFD